MTTGRVQGSFFILVGQLGARRLRIQIKKNLDRACKSMVCLELRASRSRKSAQNIDNQEFARKILRRRDLATVGLAGKKGEEYSRKLAEWVSILILVYGVGARLDVTGRVWKNRRGKGAGADTGSSRAGDCPASKCKICHGVNPSC
jgi:hypothetical protein